MATQKPPFTRLKRHSKEYLGEEVSLYFHYLAIFLEFSWFYFQIWKKSLSTMQIKWLVWLSEKWELVKGICLSSPLNLDSTLPSGTQFNVKLGEKVEKKGYGCHLLSFQRQDHFCPHLPRGSLSHYPEQSLVALPWNLYQHNRFPPCFTLIRFILGRKDEVHDYLLKTPSIWHCGHFQTAFGLLSMSFVKLVALQDGLICFLL